MWSLSCLLSSGLLHFQLGCDHGVEGSSYLATPAQAASLPSSSSRSFRLDFLGCESIPKAIIVAKEMQDSDWPELVSGSNPEPGLEAGDGVR